MTVTVNIDYKKLAEELAQRLEPTAPWMTVKEAAEYLRVSERWIRDRLQTRDGIPNVKVDGKTLLHRREVDSWLQTNHRRGNE